MEPLKPKLIEEYALKKLTSCWPAEALEDVVEAHVVDCMVELDVEDTIVVLVVVALGEEAVVTELVEEGAVEEDTLEEGAREVLVLATCVELVVPLDPVVAA